MDLAIFVIKSQNIKKMEKKCIFSIIFDDAALNYTGNTPKKSKFCVPAVIILINHIIISDRLIFGSIGRVKHLVMKHRNPFLVNYM